MTINDLQAKVSDLQKWVTVYCKQYTECVLPAPQKGVSEWRFRVRAKNKEGWGPFSSPLNITRRSHPSLFLFAPEGPGGGLPMSTFTASACFSPSTSVASTTRTGAGAGAGAAAMGVDSEPLPALSSMSLAGREEKTRDDWIIADEIRRLVIHTTPHHALLPYCIMFYAAGHEE